MRENGAASIIEKQRRGGKGRHPHSPRIDRQTAACCLLILTHTPLILPPPFHRSPLAPPLQRLFPPHSLALHSQLPRQSHSARPSVSSTINHDSHYTHRNAPVVSARSTVN